MRRLLYILLLLLLILPVAAQQKKPTARKPHPPKTKLSKALSPFTFQLPEIMEVGLTMHSGNKADLTQLHATGYLYGGSSKKISAVLLGIPIDATSRILGITWKDKWGLELGRASYKTTVNIAAYGYKLQALMPRYYIAGTYPYNLSASGYQDVLDMNGYNGWTVGASYSRIRKKFLLQGKLLVGVGNDGGGWALRYVDATYAYKEYGSNNVLISNVSITHVHTGKLMYAGQLIAAWLPEGPRSGFWHFTEEFGAKLELGFTPFAYRTTITDQPYNQPATTTTSTSTSYRRILGISGYWSLRISR